MAWYWIVAIAAGWLGCSWLGYSRIRRGEMNIVPRWTKGDRHVVLLCSLLGGPLILLASVVVYPPWVGTGNDEPANW